MGNYGLRFKYAYQKDNEDWTYFDTISGVRVLAIDGLEERGEAVNVYTAQWIDSDIEDYVCAKQQEVTIGNRTFTQDVIIRKNVDINVTLIVSRRYAISSAAVDEQTQYDSMVSTLCNCGSVYLWSAYAKKKVKVVCLKNFKPTAVKLHRGNDSYILVTIPFHAIKAPENQSNTPVT